MAEIERAQGGVLAQGRGDLSDDVVRGSEFFEPAVWVKAQVDTDRTNTSTKSKSREEAKMGRMDERDDLRFNPSIARQRGQCTWDNQIRLILVQLK